MFHLSLTDLKLFKTLQRRAETDPRALAFTGVLVPVTGDAAEYLGYVTKTFPTYTRHNIQHSWTILEKIACFVSEEALKELSSLELFSLILAAVFHDTGMVASTTENISADAVRDHHPKRSAEVLRQYLNERLKIMSEYTNRLASNIGFIIEAHGLDWKDMRARKEFSTPDMLGNQVMRPGLLALYLRIGDLLDLDSDRTCDVVTAMIPEVFQDRVSRQHHERHKLVSNHFVSPKAIRVHVQCENEEQHIIWEKWLGYLRRDIELANTYVLIDDLAVFRLPPPDCKIEAATGAQYSLGD
ncbi:HD domain-containing protein [Nannocystis punicea]|uniref:HD domain-containing protein n=1 Tax=Nannocystis punicea TaxID=2995304 RepID=A0ABY7H736_9BACT|nr:HD domain-containing protein [Nannocystis poenicansa]WAS95085.1 HD domain-containing protein [Nannocystis poenicansa]